MNRPYDPGDKKRKKGNITQFLTMWDSRFGVGADGAAYQATHRAE